MLLAYKCGSNLAASAKMNNHLKNIVFTLALACGLACGAQPALAAQGLRIDVQDGRETLTIPVGKTSPRKVFTMANPDRLVIDVPTLPSRKGLALPDNYDGELIKNIRSGQFDPKTSRIVLELSAPLSVLNISDSKNILSIVISSKSGASANTAPAPANKAPTKQLTKNTKTKKPLIVIDPGHGGIDPGAHGTGRSFEKDIVLSYAHTLKDHLLKTGKYRVMLTREGDKFIRLRERVAIARGAGAAMFISLHADSAPEDYAAGLSIYTVSEEASDKESEALAAQENKADLIAGVNLNDERDDVADILISLAQRETKNESAKLADLMIRSMLDQNIKLLENTHRFAGFAVLKAPDVPSVLVEVGFLSNPQEEKLLKSKAHRINVAKGLTAGIDNYMRRRKQMDDL
ncbi:MAG: N-acetylmuramoyl-L-alanine amidase [Alphaproteobacteria bacterium]|nr:N-acetylmuramoyl-L-alanine amidase [Alphaproteobacteria bacterium]